MRLCVLGYKRIKAPKCIYDCCEEKTYTHRSAFELPSLKSISAPTFVPFCSLGSTRQAQARNITRQSQQQISHGNPSNKYRTASPATNIARQAQQQISHGKPSNKYHTASPATNITRQSQQHISHGKPSNTYHTASPATNIIRSELMGVVRQL